MQPMTAHQLADELRAGPDVPVMFLDGNGEEHDIVSVEFNDDTTPAVVLESDEDGD